MKHDERIPLSGSWLAFAGLVPLFVAATDLATGFAMAGACLVVHSTCAAIALFLPQSQARARGFAVSLLGGAVAVGLYSSVVRALDPLLFERAFSRLFLVAFLAPVMRASVPPEGEAERGRGWENVLRGLGLSLAIAVTGFFRELLATGAVSVTGAPVSQGVSLLPFASHPAGAFLLLAFAAAGAKAFTGTMGRNNR